MTISAFDGEYRFLSNFEPVVIEFDGELYPSIEHAYQAAKTLHPAERAKFHSFTYLTPGQAKRLGRQVTLRPDWEEVKIQVMEGLVTYKFTAYEGLKQKLLATGDKALVEGNYWGDRFWGVHKGEGLNHLGNILMRVRDRLRKEQQP